jgi:hypothetical protein
MLILVSNRCDILSLVINFLIEKPVCSIPDSSLSTLINRQCAVNLFFIMHQYIGPTSHRIGAANIKYAAKFNY